MTAALPKSGSKPVTPANLEADSPTETRVLLEGVSWETYERLLADTGGGRSQRFAYDDGILEIMVPLRGHEEPTRLFDDFVAVFSGCVGLGAVQAGVADDEEGNAEEGAGAGLLLLYSE